jgi:hypothetical protein
MDRKNRRRQPPKLNKLQILAIRELYATRTLRELSIIFGISESAIQNIVAGKSWKKLPVLKYNKQIPRKGKRLTKERVMEIRRLSSIKTRRELAEMFDVTIIAIGDVINHKTWKHVSDDIN